ncbi:MAG: molybdopterin molybdenumtransferase MoeA [Anaerolineales bacterium]|nr:molybdopterin molybdenumtransferase MoeA [Anaerolineales bacterium]
MPEFLDLLPPQEALNVFLSAIRNSVHHLDFEEVDTENSLGRILAKPIFSPHPLPEFPRSTVDGYAVRAADTFGASESLPAYLSLIGEIPMGDTPKIILEPNQSALIHTGGMIPNGADAVVMLEDTQSVRDTEIEVLKSVAVGENVIQIGEDVQKGEVVIPAGMRLRPAEIGGLMALGFVSVKVVKKPRIGIISSGDEVIPPNQTPRLGQVRDVNAYTLSALVESVGGEPIGYGIVGDNQKEMLPVLKEAMKTDDMVIITAGSSASTRDLTADVINNLGKPGVLVHGVNIRPGKPTILGISDGVVMVGLPGNPVSALSNSYLFVVPAIKTLLGEITRGPRPTVKAKLAINIASQTGREDWIPVRILETEAGYLADPIFGRSNLIFTLARAVGLIRIPLDANGLEAGEIVDVVYM